MTHLRDIVTGQSFPIRGPTTVVGRAWDCDVVLSDPGISVRHAAVIQNDSGYVIRDLRSLNGTLLNGRRLVDDTELRSGDRIGLPGVTLAFEVDSGEASPEETVAVVSSINLSAAGTSVGAEAKLKAVLEISNNLGRTLDLVGVLPKILESLFSIFPQADRGFVILRDHQTGRLVTGAVRERRPSASGPPEYSRTVTEHALRNRMAILSADAVHDSRFDASQSVRQLHLRSVMCVPMFTQSGEELGAIQLDALYKNGQFAAGDLNVLACASLQAARALELANLHEERRDFEAATRVQKSFLPSSRPQVPGLEFFDHYVAARHVSGDYFDYIRLPGDRLAIAVGDVTGKGFSAALLMARLSAATRFCLATEPTPAAALRALNAVMMQTGETGRFVTFVAVILDLRAFTLTIVNAGHPPPLRCRPGGGEPEELGVDAVGIPIGVLAHPYEQSVAAFDPGDTIVMYTDGVTESRNAQREMYGAGRLRAVLRAQPGGSVQTGRRILDDLRRFSGERPLADDLTLVCFGRVAAPK